MPEQPQWSERTLNMPPQDPWADAPTAPEAYPTSYDPPTRLDENFVPETVRTPRATPGDTVRTPRATPGDTVRTPRATPPAAPKSAPPAAPQSPAPESPFSKGRAQVKPQEIRQAYAEHENTGTGWPAEPAPAVPAASWRWSDLRRGGEWTTAFALFAFVGWGIWAIAGGGDLTTPVIIYIVSMLVAVGVFCLARVVGHLVFERQLRRVRQTARGSHMVTALYLAFVGVAFLRETPWVTDAFSWVAKTF